MKATIKFNLDNPDDREAHLRCTKSVDMASVLFEFSINSRKKVEQRISSLEHNPDSFEVMEIIFGEFQDLMEGNGLNINELIS